jgi:hypothetical protein
MAARLSALCAGCPLPPGFLWRFLVLISVRGWVDSRAIVRPEGLGKLEKINLIGTWSHNLPVCSIVPQPLHYCVWAKCKTFLILKQVAHVVITVFYGSEHSCNWFEQVMIIHINHITSSVSSLKLKSQMDPNSTKIQYENWNAETSMIYRAWKDKLWMA